MKELARTLLFSPVGIYIVKALRLVYRPVERHAGKLKFKGAFELKTTEGARFRLYNNAFVFETHLFWLGLQHYSWERETRRIWNHLCPQSDVILDIGANSGIFAVLAKVYNPQATVVAFEPQPNIFYALTKNNSINDFDIRCENIALSDRSGRMPFYNYGPNTFTDVNTTAGSLNKNWREDRQSSIEVEVAILKDYCEKHQIRNIDLIKMDVETHEFEVLLGYKDLLYRHRPLIILEVQDEVIGNRIQTLLEGTDYQFFNIHEQEGIRQVMEMGNDSGNHNYLICPAEKIHQLSAFTSIAE